MSVVEIAFLPLALLPLLAFAFLAVIVFLIVRTLISRQDNVKLSREEAEQLQYLLRSVDRMEERIANLETILQDKGKEAPREYHHEESSHR